MYSQMNGTHPVSLIAVHNYSCAYCSEAEGIRINGLSHCAICFP